MMGLSDQAERSRALTDFESTLLVEAGAGSGKTSLMAGRVALMLADGIHPENIAAITFTELAAGQLFSRISEFVDELLDGKLPYNLVIDLPNGLNDAQRINIESARQVIGELTATTIHGFCQQLVRPYPIEANVDPGATLMDEAQASLAWGDRLKTFLHDRLDVEADGSPLATYVTALGGLAEWPIGELTKFLRKHRTTKAAAVRYDPTTLDAFIEAVELFTGWLNGLEYVEETTGTLATELGLLIDRYKAELTPSYDDVAIVRLAVDPPICSAHTKEHSWGKKWGRKGRWETTAVEFGRSKAEGGHISAEGEALYHPVGEAWVALQGLIGADAFRILANDFDGLLDGYAAYKRDAALLDFDDLLLKAADLLRTNDQVRTALGNRYKYILVDEFQDTDPLQAEILWRLCGEGDPEVPWQERALRPGALFCVGDPKQAIYRFRGADVDTYVEARTAIGNQFPQNILKITANFRSLSTILDWVNERFAEPLSSPGQPGFQNLEATQEPSDNYPRVIGLEVPVSLAGEKLTVTDIRESEADAVASLCHRLIGSFELDGRKNDPLVKPGDIALLAPAGTDLWRYERALEDHGIPVASQAGKGFFRRQEIQDLIAITRTLSDPRDTVAFGALMRGPMVGLTEEEILDIVDALPILPNTDRLPRFTLGNKVEDIQHPLARHVLGVLQRLARLSNSTAPFTLLAEAVEELGIRPILTQRHPPGGAERALANVDRFLEMARPYSVRGLQRFAGDMRQRWEDSESEVEGRPDAEEQAVNLITMHSAKGLEWPIVIPINTSSGPKGPSGMLHDHSADRLVHRLGRVKHQLYEEVLENEKGQQTRENIRILYVAFTRAAELLVFPILSDGESKWFDLMSLDLPALQNFDAESYDAELPAKEADQKNQQDAKDFAEEAKRIADVTRKIQWSQPSRHEWSSKESEEIEASRTVFTEEDIPETDIQGGPVRGNILHKLMEETLNGEVEDSIAALTGRARNLIEQLGETVSDNPKTGLSPAELAETTHNTWQLPAVQELRGSMRAEYHIYAWSESEESPDTEIAVSGIADAVVTDEAGKISAIIDWKSDLQPSDAQRQLYRRQVHDYLSATGAMHGLVVYMTHGLVDEIKPD